MYTLLKPIHVREALVRRGIRIVSRLEFERIFETHSHRAKYFLERQTREGLFVRLKKGLYGLQTDPPAEEEIANRLYQPSYISFEYALAYWQILPEMPYTVTSATTKPTRLFAVNGIAYSYRSIQPKAYTGYVLQKKEQRSFLMAEPEKALVDYLYFVMRVEKSQNDRLHLSRIRKGKLMRFARLFGSKKLLVFLDARL